MHFNGKGSAEEIQRKYLNLTLSNPVYSQNGEMKNVSFSVFETIFIPLSQFI